MITDLFLIGKWRTSEREGGASAKTYKIKIVRIVFVLAFFKLLINKEPFWRSFSFLFSAKYFGRNFKYSF